MNPTSTAQARVFTFDTTHHAMWAEDVAHERQVPVEVVPAPAESGAKCGIALQTLPDRIPVLEAAFENEGIEYRLYPELNG